MAILKPSTWFSNKQNQTINKYNQALFSWLGGGYTSYDTNNNNYIDKGYNYNPVVYSVINQRSKKVGSVPFYIKIIDNKYQKSKRDSLLYATKFDLTPQQEVKRLILESKAFKEDYKEMPLERPNPLQTWMEFFELAETFLASIGNVYIYLQSPNLGINKDTPIAWYLLPSHLTQIVLKKNVNFQSKESPIDSYILTEGNQFIEFKFNEVVHIKYSNPNYDTLGSHLYGQSPLRAALRNMQSSNEAIDLNNKALKSGGAFGLIHSKGNSPLTTDQATQLKERLTEMDSGTGRLDKIAGVSAEIGFTRLSLTTDELKPFDYLSFDEKQICNVLGWSDKLLNNDDGAKYDNVNQFRKKVITDTIQPDLNLIQQAINSIILPKYKGYEGSCFEFDVTDLPEMQQDIAAMMAWLKPAIDIGLINRNEGRVAMRYPISQDKNMDIYTVASDIITLDQAIHDMPLLEPKQPM